MTLTRIIMTLKNWTKVCFFPFSYCYFYIHSRVFYTKQKSFYVLSGLSFRLMVSSTSETDKLSKKKKNNGWLFSLTFSSVLVHIHKLYDSHVFVFDYYLELCDKLFYSPLYYYSVFFFFCKHCCMLFTNYKIIFTVICQLFIF